MVLDWYIAEMQQRYEERVREMECRRYVQEVAQANPTPNMADKALASIGHFLAEWGRQLEARHTIACVSGIADGLDTLGDLSIDSVPSRASTRVTGRAYRR